MEKPTQADDLLGSPEDLLGERVGTLAETDGEYGLEGDLDPNDRDPIVFSHRLMNVIMNQVFKGLSLGAICRQPMMPTLSQVSVWIKKYGYRARYDSARYRDPYSLERYLHILTRVENGETLRAILEEHGMPTRAMFYKWRDKTEENRKAYGLAKLAGSESLVDEALHIADSEPHLNEEGEMATSFEEAPSRKLRVETRLKLAAFSNPAYSEKKTTVLSNPDGSSVIPENNDLETARRVAFLLSQGMVAHG